MPRKTQFHEIIDFLEQISKLKATPRFCSSLKTQEPTASHCWRVAFMTFLLAEELNVKINTKKALQLALIHDLPEAITGDIDATDIINKKISKKEKTAAERKAIGKITNQYSFGKNIKKLWTEYEQHKTKEAKFVNAIDKIEGYLHIKEVGHKKYTPKVFHANYADEAVNGFPQLNDFLKAVKKLLKKELAKGNIEWREY